MTRHDELEQLLGGQATLPAAPRAYTALMSVLERRDCSAGDIAKVLQVDPAISIAVLHLVNSVYFGRAQKVVSLDQAVVRVGVEAIKGFVLKSHILEVAKLSPMRGMSIEVFQNYSTTAARLAKSFVVPARHDEAFTCGLLHDVGKLVLAMRLPDKFAAALEQHSATTAPAHVLERELVGASHAEAGAYLLRNWQLPDSITRVVEFHHMPATAPGPADEVLAAIHAVDALVDIVFCGEPESRLDVDYLAAAKVLDRLPKWRASVEAEVKR